MSGHLELEPQELVTVNGYGVSPGSVEMWAMMMVVYIALHIFCTNTEVNCMKQRIPQGFL